jgi:hypothetical protein
MAKVFCGWPSGSSTLPVTSRRKEIPVTVALALRGAACRADVAEVAVPATLQDTAIGEPG